MLQTFLKYAGGAQGIIGLLGQFVPQLGTLLGTATGGNVFNILSGGAMTALGMKGSPSAQATGATALSGLNGLVGILGLLGPNNPLAGMDMGGGTVANIINIGIAAWGLYARFAKKPS